MGLVPGTTSITHGRALPRTALSTGLDGDSTTWRDSSVLINCLTILMIACLVPQAPFAHVYLTVATYAFVGLALANHLFPQRLQLLTHAVKAAYTNLLFAAVGPRLDLGPYGWLWPAAVTALDLLPLLV